MMNNEEKNAGLGEVVELPGPIGAKGVVTIELRDKDGEVVERQSASNFIGKGMDVVYRAAMLSVFSKGTALNKATNAGMGTPLSKMILTDAKHDAVPGKEWTIKGGMIGYATTDKPVTNTNDYQGTYNSEESRIDVDRVRIVVDFATNQANGETGSVYFTSPSLTPVVNVDHTPGLLVNTFGKQNNADVIVKHNQKYYRVAYGGTITVYDLSYNVEFERNVGDGTSNGRRNYGGTIYNNHLYFVSSLAVTWGSSPNYLYRLPLSNLDAPLEQIPIPGSTSLGGIAYHPTKNQFFVGLNGLSIYNTSFQLLQVLPLYTVGSTFGSKSTVSTQPFVYDPDIDEVLFASGTYDNAHSVNLDTGEAIERGGGFKVHGVFDGLMVTGSRLNPSLIMPKVGFTSRFKLPSPVTKTTSVTMKVTYDFLLPTIYD